MPIAVRCRLCGRPYNLADRYAGRVVQCKACQAAIEVPVISTPRPARPAALGHAAPVAVASAESPRRPVLAPLAGAEVIVAVPPRADSLSPPPLRGNPLLPPRKKKSSNVPIILAAVAASVLGLVALVAIGGMAFGRFAPILISWRYRSRASTPTMPVTLKGNDQIASNTRQFEELLQKSLAALQGFNNALAPVVDSASARRQSDQVLARYNELMRLLPQVASFKPRLTADEDRRLESMYSAPLTSAVEQMKMHVARIRQIQQADLAFGGQLPFDDLHQRMGAFRGPRLGFGSAASFQPPTPPAFQPRQNPHPRQNPGFASQAPITRPRPPTMGHGHPPLNHGMRGPRAMHGPRGR